MSVVETRYAVEGWGAGELRMRDGLLVAHWFDFAAVARVEGELGDVPEVAPPGPREGSADLVRGAQFAPPMGEPGPPGATLAVDSGRMGYAFVPEEQRPASPSPIDAAALVERVRAYLAGVAVGFDEVELDLDGCTPFQRAATEALRAVPRGEVVTYGELAALAGHPGAQRAAGTFCASNRFAFVVPCHRVVSADGIGGYGSTGVAVKRRLLALEGVDA